MVAFTQRCALALVALTTAASALDGIVAPSEVAAGQTFEVTFQDANNDQYRVYLAASLAGSNGPTCYLINQTTLHNSVNLTIPSGVGPTANYYSIAIADLSTNQASTFSNRFNLTGANGSYTAYEDSLGGSPFWSADDLPCSAYPCARKCAQASYPDDLTSTSAYNTMKQCILACNGVTNAAEQTAPAHASSTGASSTITGEMAVLTLGPSAVVTAIETTKNGHTMAIIGSETITLGGDAATISNEAVSLATSGVDVGGSTTVAFSSTTATVADVAAATQSQDSSAGKQGYLAGAAAAGFAGLAFVL